MPTLFTFHRRIVSMTVEVLILVLFCSRAGAQISHSYPRICVHQFGGAVPEWYAKHDMVVFPTMEAQEALAIKALNPNCYVLSSSDWNTGLEDRGPGTIVNPFPEQWFARNSKGEKIPIYSNNYSLVDMTNYCLPYEGDKFNEYLPEYLAIHIDLNAFDGVASQGLWDRPWGNGREDIDLNRNGVNDYVEHDRAWVDSVWAVGIETLLANLRTRITSEKLILINSGGFHDYGWQTTNGIRIENSWSIRGNYYYFIGKYERWMEQALEPHILMVNGTAKYDEIHRPPVSKDYFMLMRFLLATTLMGDGYFNFEDVESGEHYYSKHYDEFDLDLGYPTSTALRILCERVGYNDQCVFVRFFDNGAVIVNAKGSQETVTASDLSGLEGYQGPYYRFRGGQDTEHNDGEIFDTITLFSAMDDPAIPKKIVGDGIILLKEPQTVVSDIIIDNVDAGTSPGSAPPEYVGNWTQEHWEGAGYYTLRVASWLGLSGQAHTHPDSGSAEVLFTPTIGVPGYYEIYEWHGWNGESANSVIEASNVPCKITFGTGQTHTLTLDQSINPSQWNSLGTYYFIKGQMGHVELSNNANGLVLADAFKFVYRGGDPPIDIIPPTPPEGLKIEAPD